MAPKAAEPSLLSIEDGADWTEGLRGQIVGNVDPGLSPGGWQGGAKFDLVPANRMGESQATGVQSDTERKLAATAVLPITQNGVPGGGKLEPNLVFAAGFQSDFEQCSEGEMLPYLELQASLLPAARTWENDVHAAVAFVFAYPIDQGDLSGGGASFDDGPIGFVYLAGAELFGQASGRFGGAGEQNDAGDGSV